MNNFTFPTGGDPALLFGCGRFRMEEHLLENCAEEIVRFGRQPLLVCDDNSHAVAFDKVAASPASSSASCATTASAAATTRSPAPRPARSRASTS